MADLSNINSGIVNYFTGSKGTIVSALSWFFVAIIAICIVVGAYWYYSTNKKFGKKITVFEVIGANYSPAFRDKAKSVRLGKGGFEVLFLRKLKTWKVAYGGRIGKDTYYFFIGKDGYWYNGMLSADINQIDKNKGLVPVVTTNPTMRAQYTALEKQIDALHGERKTFWDKYGTWVLSISFVLVFGIFAWLIFREMSPLMGQFTSLTQKMGELTDKMNELVVNLNGGNTGLVPA